MQKLFILGPSFAIYKVLSCVISYQEKLLPIKRWFIQFAIQTRNIGIITKAWDGMPQSNFRCNILQWLLSKDSDWKQTYDLCKLATKNLAGIFIASELILTLLILTFKRLSLFLKKLFSINQKQITGQPRMICTMTKVGCRCCNHVLSAIACKLNLAIW